MKTLKEKLYAVKPALTLEECEKLFQEIAYLLLQDYAIQNGENIYRLTDIEFYYYGPNVKDERTDKPGKRVTYERTTPAGQWFFHASGVDLTFESDKDKGYGGGILIRGIKQVAPKEEKAITGSLKAYWKLFDENVSAFDSTSPNPHLIRRENAFDVDMCSDLRHGLEEKDKYKRLWQYYAFYQ